MPIEVELTGEWLQETLKAASEEVSSWAEDIQAMLNLPEISNPIDE